MACKLGRVHTRGVHTVWGQRISSSPGGGVVPFRPGPFFVLLFFELLRGMNGAGMGNGGGMGWEWVGNWGGMGGEGGGMGGESGELE